MGQIKGLALLGAVRLLRSMGDQALPLLPENVHYLLEDRIFPSGWYSADDLMVALESLEKLIPGRPDLWEWFGAEGAKNDFTKVYSALIRPGRPDLLLASYPRMWRLYHDHGQATAEEIAPFQWRLEIQSPLVVDGRFCRLQSGHTHALLELSGAEGVSIESLDVADPETGKPATWDIRWRGAGPDGDGLRDRQG